MQDFAVKHTKLQKILMTAGDYQLAEYIMALMSNANTFIPQLNENESAIFEKIESIRVTCFMAS